MRTAATAGIDTLTRGLAAEVAGEVAPAVAYLMSPEASYTTGTIIRIAGGR